jgi:hydroxyacylglutathione hydrolase
VIFRQFVDVDLGCASYLIGDEDEGTAAVVDPGYAVEQYLDEAERHGLTITRVVETHTHADHLSGHGRLALDHGCTVFVHPAGNPEFPFSPLEDGTEVRHGDVTLRAIHTPGHRPEHTSLAVGNGGDAPSLVLTGDSLFVGDAARPDLAVDARQGAEGLFHSLQRLTQLPDGAHVYPGHVAGSLCGAAMSPERSSTIGAEKRTNHALQFVTLEDFVDESSARGAQLRPPNMERIVQLNRGPFVGAPLPLVPIESADGATILDVRNADDFAAGHVHGAINVSLDASAFATKSAFLLGPDERVVLHASSADEAERAALGLHAVAVLNIAGYVVGPPADEQLDPIGIEELERLLAAGEIEVIDVREKDERDRGYIAGTRHIPYRLLRMYTDKVECGKPIVTICESGARAAVAASVLAAGGVEARPMLHGGVHTWQERGGHTVEFRRCGT